MKSFLRRKYEIFLLCECNYQEERSQDLEQLTSAGRSGLGAASGRDEHLSERARRLLSELDCIFCK